MVHSSREATREERAQGAFVKDMVERQLGLGRPLFPAHRIDRPASGVLVFGRTAEACRRVRAAMAHPSAIKEYLVLVRGSPPNEFTCDKPLKDDRDALKPALSHFRRLLEIPQHRCALLSVRISTGRRHQIRRHLNHLAFQVIGDSVHGKGRINAHFRQNHHLPPSRLFLHAARLLLPLHAHAPEAEPLPLLTPDGRFIDAPEEESSHPLNTPERGFPLLHALEGEFSYLHTLPVVSTLESSVGRAEGLLEIVAPLPDDLIQVLLSLGLDTDTIISLNQFNLAPETHLDRVRGV
ncbi:unnamed protein product [Closterium sp. Yama58-4]|nr:unnamed protein product [Closterium sp. Yama58-4]